MQAAKALGGSFKLVTLVPKTVREINCPGKHKRMGTYDFLLVFHSNYGPILYHFQDNWQFSHPVFNVHAEYYPWNFETALWLKKLE